MNASLYVIGPKEGPYKVGRATNVASRFSSHQTGNPKTLHIFAQREVEDAFLAEKTAHETLSNSHVRGEWFDCSLEEACRAIGVDQFSSDPVCPGISAPEFRAFLADMKPPFTENEVRCALGMTKDEFEAAKRTGGPAILALACRAAYHGFAPYQFGQVTWYDVKASLSA